MMFYFQSGQLGHSTNTIILKINEHKTYAWVFGVICGSPVLGDHNTGILVLCTILVSKNIPVLYSSIVPVLLN